MGLSNTFKANIYPKQDNLTGQMPYGEGKLCVSSPSININNAQYIC